MASGNAVTDTLFGTRTYTEGARFQVPRCAAADGRSSVGRFESVHGLGPLDSCVHSQWTAVRRHSKPSANHLRVAS